MKPFKRDGRAPTPAVELTSRVMRANKAKNTGPELRLRASLSSLGVLGFRLHADNLPGKPDLCFPKKKLAVFVNGCFWHRCPYCQDPLPKSHRSFWARKFQNNKRRDLIKSAELRKLGWRVLTIWECKIKKDVSSQSSTIISRLSKRKVTR